MRKRHRLRLLGAALAGVAIVAAVASAGAMSERSAAPAACPDGYKPVQGNACLSLKHPESLIELEIRGRQFDAVRSAPHGKTHPSAFAGALEQRSAMPSSVDGSQGTWRPVGHGPLISNGPAYSSVNGLGLVNLQGRIDSLTYDPANRRLFAAKGTGGIWLSTDFGDTWRSIGDSLPSQVVGAVAWSSANGGTVVAVSGDPTFGSGGYTGYGAFYSTNLGKTWKKAKGIPDGALGFEIEVDPTNPLEIYAATLFGLYRSTDGGKNYTNVNLPTGECSGVAGGGHCQLANIVTDIAIKGTGGVNADVPAGTVIAAIGWRAGRRKNADGTTQSEHNGLYRSLSGSPNTFVKLGGSGFTPQERIGRVEFGPTTGASQDKDYLYAIVQDAVVLNGGIDVIDAPENFPPAPVAGGTVLNGLYVSKDFGATWTLMADDNVIAKNPATGSALVGVGMALGFEPGVQAWYNEWIAPDPTRQSATGVPTRLAFGLEEVWQNELPLPMDGPATFKVIGRYFSDSACLMLTVGLPECPTNRPPTTSKTTHPDQHEGVWIPDTLGGVTLAVGNDGGFYKNHVAPGHEIDNGGWGDGNQTGFNTLLPYDVAMANDGTVSAGLQDNGHMKITPAGEQFMVFGGDGTFAEIDPANSDVIYEAYVFNDMSVSTDGGKSWRGIDPGLTNTRFVNPFEMDPTDAKHIVTGGNEIAETRHGSETEAGHDAGGNTWSVLYDLGTQQHPGDAAATPSPTDPANGMSAIDVHGDVIYAGYCGVCDALNAQAAFKSGIATNADGYVAHGRGNRAARALHHLGRDRPGEHADDLRHARRLQQALGPARHAAGSEPGRGRRSPLQVDRRRRDLRGHLGQPPGRPRHLGHPAGCEPADRRHRHRRVRERTRGRHDVRAAARAAGRADLDDEPEAERPEPARRRDVRPRDLDVHVHEEDPRRRRRRRDGRAAGGAAGRPARRTVRVRAHRRGVDDRPVGQPAPRLEARGPGAQLRVELPAHAVLRRVDCDGHLPGRKPARRLDVRRLPEPA